MKHKADSVEVLILVRKSFCTSFCPNQKSCKMIAKPKRERWVTAILMVFVLAILIFYFRSAAKQVIYPHVRDVDSASVHVDLTHSQLVQCRKLLAEERAHKHSITPPATDCPKIECPKVEEMTEKPRDTEETIVEPSNGTKQKKKGFHFVFNLDCHTHRATRYFPCFSTSFFDIYLNYLFILLC